MSSLKMLPKKKIVTVKRKRTTSRRVKKSNSFNEWYNLTNKVVKSWNAQPNPPKVYVGDRRMHHGTVGLGSAVAGGLLLIVSALSDDKTIKSLSRELSPALLGIGTSLMIDDLPDLPNWFNFEHQQNIPSVQPPFQTAYVQPLQFHSVTVLPIGQSPFSSL
ncbi:MAG: hypothetical protein WAL88_01640 [Nitrosotalea sp.]